jgi:hypothetical protein
MEVQRHPYLTRGIDRTPGAVFDMLADDELWARKGVLLARINMGVGTIDLYLTHLYSGEGLLADAPWYVKLALPGAATMPPTNEEREDVRSAQLRELADFIRDTHRPQNVAVLCGDLNIDARGGPGAFRGLEQLRELTAERDLIDIWVFQREADPGFTIGNFGTICDVLQSDRRFCADPTAPDLGGAHRIDYLFIERPQAQHSFMLDVTRVRRRPFQWSTEDGIQLFMSDHLGLDCTLFASRK